MVPDDRCASVRLGYAGVASDPGRLWEGCSEDVAFHVAGNHPLSGSYLGRDAVQTYLDAIRRVPGCQPGFTVVSVLSDPRRQLLLVEGTAWNGTPAFIRPVVHVLRFRDGKLAEFWDHPFDQHAEDAFWRSCTPPSLPLQRLPGRVATPPLGRI